MRQQPSMLLYVSDSSTQQHGGLGPNILVSDSDFSTLRLDEPVEAAKERRLARSALADERDRTACRNFDAYVVEGDDIAKTMCDIARGE
jgi:hypothetical protein